LKFNIDISQKIDLCFYYLIVAGSLNTSAFICTTTAYIVLLINIISHQFLSSITV